MKKITLILTVLMMMVLSCSVAFAGSQDFTLVNKTGVDIASVYVSPTHTNDWEEDVMGEGVLMNGESVKITFDGYKAHSWDVRVEDSDGNALYWTGFDLPSITTITLKPNGDASYR